MNMKPFLLLITSLILPAGSAQAQYIEIADQNSVDVVYDVFIPVGSNYAVAAWSNPDGLFGGLHNYVRLIDASGALQATLQVPMPTTWGSNHGTIMRSRTDGLWLFGPEDGCDYLDYSRLLRYTAEGVEMLDHSWLEDGETPFGLFSWHMAKAPGTALAIPEYDSMYITDTTGQVLEVWDIPVNTVGTLLWTSDSTLLISDGDSLVHVDIHGEVLSDRKVGSTVNDLRSWNDDLLVLCADTIHQFTQALEAISSSAYVGEGYARGFIGDSGPVHFQAGGELFKWEPDLGAVSRLAPELLPGQTIRGMWLQDTILYTSSTVDTHGFATGLVRTYGLSGGSTEHDLDIGITNVEVDSSWTTCSSSPGGPAYCGLYANVSLELVNFGSETIDEVVLAHRSGFPVMFCGQASSMLRLSGLGLLPGATTSVTMNDLIVRYDVSSLGQLVTRDVCITALSPNNLIDRQPEDNRNCTSISAIMPVGFNEPEQRARLTVTPNPFTENFMLGYAVDGAASLDLYDPMGRHVRSIRLMITDGQARLDLSDLGSGLYHATLTTANERVSVPIVRVDR